MGALSANILLVNNYRDAETDAAARKRTLVVRFGKARWQGSSMQRALAVALCGADRPSGPRAFGAWCLLPLALAPLAWTHLRRLAPGASPADLVALLGDTAKLTALYAGLFAAGVLL